jgi:hypothetical protein
MFTTMEDKCKRWLGEGLEGHDEGGLFHPLPQTYHAESKLVALISSLSLSLSNGNTLCVAAYSHVGLV